MQVAENANPFLECYESVFRHLLDDFEQSEEAIVDGLDSPADAASDTYLGYPVIGRAGAAVQLNPWPEGLLARRNTYMTAPRSMWGAKSQWADGAYGWKPLELSVKDFLNAFAHPNVVRQKDGTMFAACTLRGNERKAEAVSSIHAMVFDSDVGQTLDDILPKLQKAGRCYILYTSFSNGKTSSSIALKKLKPFAADLDNPTDAELRSYLSLSRAEGGLGYWPAVAESATITAIVGEVVVKGDKEVDERKVKFSHAPISKYRIVFPLAEAFVVGENLAKSGKEWEALYAHIARALGIDLDRACKDMNRAFYTGRTPSLDRYQCVIGGTTPLVLPEVTDEMLAAVGYSNSRNRDAALAALGERKTVEGIPDVSTFYWLHGEEFDVVGWLNALDWKMRSGAGIGKEVIRCPNEDSHSAPGGTGCVAIETEGSKNGKAIITCRHDHCQGLHTEDFMRLICEEVKETRVDYDLPALENFVFEIIEDEAPASDDEPATASVDSPKSEPSKDESVKPPKQRFAKTRALLKHMTTYKINDFGWIEYKSGKKDEDPIPVCKAFEVLGQTRTKDGLGWGLLIEFADPEGRVHRDTISESDLHDSKGLRKRLADQGLKIAVGSTKFDPLIQRLEPKELVLLVSKPGWIDAKRFVAPDGEVYGANGGETVILENKLPNQRAGTLEGQQDAWDISFQYGDAHHFIGCLAGVAGSLVEYADLDMTPIVTLSGSSSSGKTTAMALGASAFGCPDIKKPGLIHTLRGTDNAIEYLAARSNGTYLGLDETAHLDPGSLEKLIFMVASGRGKHRMKADSSERAAKEWATFAMVSSEQALGDLVERTGRSARVGFAARVADLDVSNARPIPETEYLRMTALLKENFGHIGPLFVEALVQSGETPEAIRAEIDAKVHALAGGGASPLIWRSAGVFGVLWQVGEMLMDIEVIPELKETTARGQFASETGNSVEAKIKAIWKAYVSSAEAEALKPEQKGVDVLREALYSRRGRDVHDLYPVDGQKGGFGEALAWFKKAEKGTTFFVRADKLTTLVNGTMKKHALCKALEDEDILVRASDKNRTHPRLPDGEQVQHYRLKFDEEAEYDPFR